MAGAGIITDPYYATVVPTGMINVGEFKKMAEK
jgi:hypothetical protein